jgi:hypothetical protein
VVLVAVLAIGRLLGLSGYLTDALVALLLAGAVVVPIAYLVIFLRGVRAGWKRDDD